MPQRYRYFDLLEIRPLSDNDPGMTAVLQQGQNTKTIDKNTAETVEA